MRIKKTVSEDTAFLLRSVYRIICFRVLFFKVQESIKFSMAESYMLSSIQPLNMLNLLIIN